MHVMFAFAKSFNLPIGDQNTSQVKDMSTMFEFAKEFNQQVGEWDTSQVKDDPEFKAKGRKCKKCLTKKTNKRCGETITNVLVADSCPTM